MKKILIVGHSHIKALTKAKPVDDLFEFYSIREKGIDDLFKLNSNDYRSIILSIAGNQHTVIGLVNFPEPFDFILPEKIDLPLQKGVRLLPVNLVAKIFEHHSIHLYDTKLKISEFFKHSRIYHIESPPPLTEEHIREHPAQFKEKIDKLGVSPATFRYKLWRLHSKFVRDNCQKLNITFTGIPEGVQNNDGLLCEKYSGHDAAHANEIYGNLVLNQICALHNIEIKQVSA